MLIPGRTRFSHCRRPPMGPPNARSPVAPGYSPGPMARGNRYHVVSKIARGGMAEIFLALQLGEQGFQKPVVLKRILPTLAEDQKFVRMFVDEAHIASTLNHSNLVQVLDLGRSGAQDFLVLE